MTALVVAHRGGAGLRPENTLAAFAHALELGAEGFELDVQLTADDELVVHHDYRPNPQIARGADGHWLTDPGPPICDLTLDQLRTYDVGRLDPHGAYAAAQPEQVAVDGEGIPTLGQVLKLVRDAGADQLELWVELKAASWATPECASPLRLADAVVALLRREGFAERSLLLCFDWNALAHARSIAPEIPRVHSVGERWSARTRAERRVVMDAIAAAHGSFWFPHLSAVSRDAIADARAAGLGVATWTANETEELQRLLSLRVDSICTDYPDRLIALRSATAPD